MPKFSKKSSGFNLIGKEVSFQQKLRSETNWYSSFNFLVVLVITAFAGLALAFSVYNTSSLQTKKEEVATYANNNVNVDDKAELDQKIKILNDKFVLYQMVKDQSFNANEFYSDLTGVYAGLKVNRISYRPGATKIEAQVAIPVNAYDELPKFLSALYAKYDNVEVSKIAFESTTTPTNALSSSSASASLTLNFERIESENILSQ